jgi:polyisoprenoid-binding protein YceI
VKLQRKDYGLTWNKTLETGGVVVGDDIEIEINAEAVKAK